MSSTSRPPIDERALGELLAPHALLHARCGRPIVEHPHPGIAEQVCPFPALPPVEFAAREPEPVVRVCGIPDPSSIPPEVMRLLGDLAAACHDAYGLGVEVESPDEREAAQLAVETLRRYLG